MIRIDKNRDETTKKTFLPYYNLLIAQGLWKASLSNFINNLSEGIHKIKCKYKHDLKKM